MKRACGALVTQRRQSFPEVCGKRFITLTPISLPIRSSFSGFPSVPQPLHYPSASSLAFFVFAVPPLYKYHLLLRPTESSKPRTVFYNFSLDIFSGFLSELLSSDSCESSDPLMMSWRNEEEALHWPENGRKCVRVIDTCFKMGVAGVGVKFVATLVSKVIKPQ